VAPAADLEAGQCGLGHSGSGGELNLRQAEREAAVADGLADEIGALGFGLALAGRIVTGEMPTREYATIATWSGAD
jgi:hypothetical protein